MDSFVVGESDLSRARTKWLFQQVKAAKDENLKLLERIQDFEAIVLHKDEKIVQAHNNFVELQGVVSKLLHDNRELKKINAGFEKELSAASTVQFSGKSKMTELNKSIKSQARVVERLKKECAGKDVEINKSYKENKELQLKNEEQKGVISSLENDLKQLREVLLESQKAEAAALGGKEVIENTIKDIQASKEEIRLECSHEIEALRSKNEILERSSEDDKRSLTEARGQVVLLEKELCQARIDLDSKVTIVQQLEFERNTVVDNAQAVQMQLFDERKHRAEAQRLQMLEHINRRSARLSGKPINLDSGSSK
eukprot:TRINITY_DN8929_c0_g1_i1.p1 TRINITY_DN8929_c0_g1~~TRINITY_DN8929_c0_g1_i1.p1  ORF type:complete len:312 (-),score=59.80 TRINITY_DN8929_c0_g1_i1:98-1033(-)